MRTQAWSLTPRGGCSAFCTRHNDLRWIKWEKIMRLRCQVDAKVLKTPVFLWRYRRCTILDTNKMHKEVRAQCFSQLWVECGEVTSAYEGARHSNTRGRAEPRCSETPPLFPSLKTISSFSGSSNDQLLCSDTVVLTDYIVNICQTDKQWVRGDW